MEKNLFVKIRAVSAVTVDFRLLDQIYLESAVIIFFQIRRKRHPLDGMIPVFKNGFIRIADRSAARSLCAEHDLHIFVIVDIFPKNVKPAIKRTVFLFKTVGFIPIHINPEAPRTIKGFFLRIHDHN